MPICLVCTTWGSGPLCAACRAGLEPVGPTVTGELAIVSGFRHTAAARRLVHLVKYQGVRSAADPLVAGMAEKVPEYATELVPVPRAVMRRIRYGVDPAVLLARRLGRITGLPVVAALRARVWWPAHAGQSRERRQVPRFVVVGSVSANALLVDDVATTGATLHSAAQQLGVSMAITATRADRPSFDRIGQRKFTSGFDSALQ